MAVQKGSSFLLKDNSTGTPATIGGLRSTSMSINGEMVDVQLKIQTHSLQVEMIKQEIYYKVVELEVCQYQQVEYSQIHQQKTF